MRSMLQDIGGRLLGTESFSVEMMIAWICTVLLNA